METDLELLCCLILPEKWVLFFKWWVRRVSLEQSITKENVLLWADKLMLTKHVSSTSSIELEMTSQCQNKCSKVSFSVLHKVQSALSVFLILNNNSFCAQNSMEEMELEKLQLDLSEWTKRRRIDGVLLILTIIKEGLPLFLDGGQWGRF